MLKCFIGIDPSKNSTGLYVTIYNKDKEIYKRYYIIKNKLTKKETKASIILEDRFSYLLYDCGNSEDSHELEIIKAKIFISISDYIIDVIKGIIEQYNDINIYICMEGISFGSIGKTRSIFDLAGLNYIIRSKILDYKNTIDNIKELYICPPSELKSHVVGNGNANKIILLQAFKIIEPKIIEVLPKVDDICDAYFMGQYIKERVS